MHSYTVVGYAYKAAIRCPQCTIFSLAADYGVENPQDYGPWDEDWKELADIAGIADYTDEYSFDSDHFPKVLFADQAEDDDTCEDCHEKIL